MAYRAPRVSTGSASTRWDMTISRMKSGAAGIRPGPRPATCSCPCPRRSSPAGTSCGCGPTTTSWGRWHAAARSRWSAELASTSMKQSPPVRLRLLGAPSWSVGGARAVALERRDAALLAYLAMEGQAPRAALLALLWPDVQREAARNNLRQRLYRLKRAVGVELVEGSELLALAAGVDVDLRDVDAASTAGELLTGLDYGDFPQFDAWMTDQRARLRRAQCDGLASSSSQLEGEGKLAEAIALAEQLVALAPLEEHAHQRLMRLHYLRGDRSAAIAAFERCERLLKDELGARPGSETLALLKVVESATSASVSAAVKPTPASIVKPPRMIGRERDLAALCGA